MGFVGIVGIAWTKSLYLTQSYYAYALGQPANCLAYLSKVRDLTDVQSRIPTPTPAQSTSTLQVPSDRSGSLVELGGGVGDVSDGRVWALAETLRGICLAGVYSLPLLPSHFHFPFLCCCWGIKTQLTKYYDRDR